MWSSMFQESSWKLFLFPSSPFPKHQHVLLETDFVKMREEASSMWRWNAFEVSVTVKTYQLSGSRQGELQSLGWHFLHVCKAFALWALSLRKSSLNVSAIDEHVNWRVASRTNFKMLSADRPSVSGSAVGTVQTSLSQSWLPVRTA